LRWFEVTNLGSAPTALEIANTTPATVYVGTVDRGLVKSNDGLNWSTANAGLGLVPGSRLQVDALAIDPLQPTVLYVATSYLFGSTTIHQSPVGVALSNDGAASWAPLSAINDVTVAELLPIAGETGAVYALTATSRTPLALGNATTVEAAALAAVDSSAATSWTDFAAWFVAGLAALALGFALATDLRRRARKEAGTLAPRLATTRR
jgi:hypothetical protein